MNEVNNQKRKTLSQTTGQRKVGKYYESACDAIPLFLSIIIFQILLQLFYQGIFLFSGNLCVGSPLSLTG